jgi:hypothetical protein
MSSPCKVFLAVPTEASVASAELVAKQLLTKYGIDDVVIRSSQAPIDRLLQTQSPETSAVWVFYSGCNLAVANLVQEESPFPVLEVEASAAPKEIAWAIAKWCTLGCKRVAKRVHQVTAERRQAKLVEDAQLQTKSLRYHNTIAESFDENLQVTGDNIGMEAARGKVRDRIDINDKLLALVTTDRQSGFDRSLAMVPFKGAVLNLTSAFWFEQTKDIIPNHIIAVPHPYVTIAKKCLPFPIEFVVR